MPMDGRLKHPHHSLRTGEENELVARTQATLAFALTSWGRIGEAVDNFERAVEHPLAKTDVFPDLYAALAYAYCSLGRSEDAVVLCERSLAETKDTTSRTILVMEMSQTLCDIGDFEQTLAWRPHETIARLPA